MARAEGRPHLSSSLAQKRPSTPPPLLPQPQPQPLTPTTQHCTPRQRHCRRTHCTRQHRWRSRRIRRYIRTTTPWRSTRGYGRSTVPTSPIPRGPMTRLGLCSIRTTRPIISDAVAASVPAVPPPISPAEAAWGSAAEHSITATAKVATPTYLPYIPARVV